VALSFEMETGPRHQHSGAYCFYNPILGKFVTLINLIMKIMKISITILSLLFVLATYGQQDMTKQKVISPKLMTAKDIFDRTCFDKITYALYVEHNQKEYAPTKAEEVMTDVNRFLTVVPTENKSQGQIREFGLIKKYKNNIDNCFKRLGLLGSDQLGEFLYLKKESIPVHFALYADTALAFIISGAFVDNIYNTLKLTSRQRATKVVTTYILPSLKNILEAFQAKEIKYYGMTCVYGSKDFADESSTKAEFVAFIAPAKVIRRYASGDLTEDELIDLADVFISDRDMLGTIKKIKITLE